MRKRTGLHTTPPEALAALCAGLGAHLRLARARRGLTAKAVAQKLGVGVRAVREAERGNPASSLGVSVALVHLYGLASDLERVAEPTRDLEGLRLSGPQARSRARRSAPPAPAPMPVPSTPSPLPSPLGLPTLVSQSLTPEGRQALELLHRSGTLRTTELATALNQRSSRVGGVMRELRRTLHALGVGELFTDENLPNGESLFRFTGGQKA